MTRSIFFACLVVLPCCRALAGDVTVTEKRGSVFVRGSNLGDQVVMAGGPVSLTVHPLAGTTLNGNASDVVLDLPARDVVVDLRDGNDLLQLNPGDFPRDLRVRFGAGDDTALLTGGFTRHLEVDFGAGSDSAQFVGVEVGGSLVCDGGSGGAAVSMTSSSIEGDCRVDLGRSVVPHNCTFTVVEIGGRLSLTGRVTSAVDLDSVTATGGAVVSMRGGVLGLVVNGLATAGPLSLFLAGGATANASITNSQVGGGLRARLFGSDASEFGLNDGAGIGGAVRLTTGRGADSVYCGNTTFSKLRIATGAGDDVVTLEQMNAGRVSIATGPGAAQVTTINGEYSRLDCRGGAQPDGFSSTADTVHGDLKLALFGGNNQVVLFNLICDDDLVVTCGDGDDTLNFTQLQVAGQQIIKTGGGDDSGP